MARITAQDIVDEVRLHLGGETEESLSDNQILRWVNRALTDLASAYSFTELETSTTLTTSSGTAEYETTATDILEIISMVDTTNNVQLYPWNRSQYDQATQGSTSNTTGTPTFWFESGTGSNDRFQYTFFPTPAGSYTITVTYRKKPAELVLTPSATSSTLREPWDHVLVLLAVESGWRALGDDDKAYKAKLSANDASSLAERSSFTPTHVPLSPSSIVGGAR
jgi:hypothetical protein